MWSRWWADRPPASHGQSTREQLRSLTCTEGKSQARRSTLTVGSQFNLDPGTYVVTADANGPSSKTVTMHRNENADVTLTIDVK